MGQCFLYGNGGGLSNLRLQIYGGLTAPTNPKEHTIWVKTGTPITQWILTQKPTAWAETAGSVDIVYEASCSYNFSDAEIVVYNGKLNGIYGQWWMRLTDCYQSDGSTLKSVDAYVYINGSWVQFSPGWHGELFENGNQYKSVTGGWVGNNQTEIGATLKINGQANQSRRVHKIALYCGYSLWLFRSCCYTKHKRKLTKLGCKWQYRN